MLSYQIRLFKSTNEHVECKPQVDGKCECECEGELAPGWHEHIRVQLVAPITPLVKSQIEIHRQLIIVLWCGAINCMSPPCVFYVALVVLFSTSIMEKFTNLMLSLQILSAVCSKIY